jgi:hypothetical protein
MNDRWKTKKNRQRRQYTPTVIARMVQSMRRALMGREER